MQPSNFHVDVTATGKEEFFKVLSIFFEKPGLYHKDYPGTTIEYMAEHPELGLMFFEFGPDDKDYVDIWNHPRYGDSKQITVKLQKLPQKMIFESVKTLAWTWLKTRTKESYGPEPDIDGSCSRKAWRIYTTGGWWHPLVVIKNEWAEYHK